MPSRARFEENGQGRNGDHKREDQLEGDERIFVGVVLFFFFFFLYLFPLANI